jgi:predicted dehydrogenase
MVIRDCLRKVEPESLGEDIRVVGVVDPNRDGAISRMDDCDKQDAVFYRGLDEMVRKARLDGLLIGTRCNLHAPYAIKAAAYDVPLYLEKPVAISMAQATALEKAFSKSKCPVVVSFPLRVSPLANGAKQFIESGAVGSPEHIRAWNHVPYGTVYWDDWYSDYQVTGGLFLQKATHDLDYMSDLMGSPIVRVGAMANVGRVFGGDMPSGLTCSKCRKRFECLESPLQRAHTASGGTKRDHLCSFGVDRGTPETGLNEDCLSVLMEFASGAHGVYSQVCFSRRDSGARGASVSGYKGTVSFDWYRNELKRVRHFEPMSDVVAMPAGMSHFGGDQELAFDFVRMMRGKLNRSRTPIEFGIQSAYACLAAREAFRKGRFVNVRQLGAQAGKKPR